MVPLGGTAPPTYRLQGDYSTSELKRQALSGIRIQIFSLEGKNTIPLYEEGI